MNRFYLHGFEDLRAEYLPQLEETKKSLGVINLVLMLDRKYKSLHNQSLFPDLVLQPQITIVPTPTWFDRMLYRTHLGSYALAKRFSINRIKQRSILAVA